MLSYSLYTTTTYGSYNLANNLETMLETMPATHSGRLSFAHQCAAFYALQRGFKASLIAKVFGVTPSAASTLKNAETSTRRYGRVTAEWRKLGPHAFGEKYWTPEIDDRLARFRVDSPDHADLMRGRGPNPNADKHAGLWEIEDRAAARHTVEIFWAPSQGWRYRDTAADWTGPACQTSLKAREDAYASFNAAHQDRRRP
jgi:hypothetical protein